MFTHVCQSPSDNVSIYDHMEGADESAAPSAELAKLDSIFKSGGEEAARQMMQSQPMEQVAIYHTASHVYMYMYR